MKSCARTARTTWRRTLIATSLATITLAFGATGRAVADNTSEPGQIRLDGHVRQLSVDFIYIDLGAKDGLQMGDTLTVQSGSSQGEQLVTSYVAGRSASCELLSKPGTTARIAVGDAVIAVLSNREGTRITEQKSTTLSFPTPRSGVSTRSGGRTGRDSRRHRSGHGRVRGSLSLDWLRTITEEGQSTTRDPRGRFDIRGRDLLGHNLRARASIRTGRRTSSHSAGGSSFPEVRQFWFDYKSDVTSFGLRGGRLLVAEAGSFAYLDGGVVSYETGSKMELGMFLGRQPDWVDRVAKGNVYVAGTSARVPFEHFESSVLISFLREIREQDRNRDWAYLEARSRPWTALRLYARTQIQLTQRDDSERLSAEGTSSGFDSNDLRVFRSYLESRLSISARYRPIDQFGWSLSYDESSLVSEYEALKSVEDRFDRSARNGWRTTFDLKPTELWRTQIGGSLRDGDGFDTRWSINGYAERRQLFHRSFDATVQMRVFDTGYSKGSTPSITLEHLSPKGYSIELRSGLHFYRATGTTEARSDQWIRLTTSVNLPSRFRVRMEAETASGDNAIGSRFYGQVIRNF